ncbi:MAG: hypothetical protein IJB16_06555 [Clostridia bacterium]|nr:hypothetical protein [Clostridia bacterium]
MSKKHSDTKLFFLGAAITLAVWALGIFSAGRMPFLVDYIYLPTENETLSLIFPFLLLIYSVVIAVVCKRKDKDALFFGSYLFLIVPSASFLFLWINQYLGFGFEDYFSFILFLILIPAMPVLSVFDAFFREFYGNIRPVGFSEAHVIFFVVLIVACALPPIIYKFFKSK